LNPINEDRRVMRHSVLAGVLEVAAENLKHTEEVRLFEIGPVYVPRAGEKLPDEPRRLAVFLCGHRRRTFWGDAGPPAEVSLSKPLDFLDLKGVIEALSEDLHLPDVTYRPARAGYLHPGRSAEWVIAGQSGGSFGQLHPRLGEVYGLGRREVLVAEFDLE